MSGLSLVMILGGLTGAAVVLFLAMFVSSPAQGAAGLAQLDAARRRGRRQASLTADRRHRDEDARLRKVGSELGTFLQRRGVSLPPALTADLGLIGQSVETFLAQSLLGAVAGLFLPFLGLGPMMFIGAISPTIPLWLTLFGALVGALVPYGTVRRRAEGRRRDFRHVVGSFLDLVAMNLAGGRGVPEALRSATSISDGWAMVRIRDTLEAARLQGTTPWAALGQLGEELDIDELRDLAAALALVAEDGAKVRDSLTARASSMRRKELADAEGRAAAQSQSMLVAQLLLCVGFLLFLTYPAVARVLGS